MPLLGLDTVVQLLRCVLRLWVVRVLISVLHLTRRIARTPCRLPSEPTISIIGFFETASGVGVAARAMAQALANHSPKIFSVSQLAHTPHIPTSQNSIPPPLPVNGTGADIAIHIYNPDIFLSAIRSFGIRLLADNGLNIAIAIWETESPPPLWGTVLSAYDEVWTYSRFSARALEKALNRSVVVVPICIPVRQPRTRRRVDSHFIFLSMFDRHSCLERKNPQAAIRAFRIGYQSLPAGTSAVLRVKCHADTPPEMLETLRCDAGGLPVEFLTTTLDDAGMESLWQECDCLLSLHRSEGFGLPVAEALSRGIPVIASRQGGILDFADDSGCMLVSGLPAVPHSRNSQYCEWSGWLEPDLEIAAKHILRVVSDYNTVVDQSLLGREILNAAVSPRHIKAELARLHRSRCN